MKIEQLSVHELIGQLLTTDYGGASVKRACLVRLLQYETLGQSALSLLKDPSGKPHSLPANSRDA